MAKIYSPVKRFTGVVVGVSFVNGEAETDNPAAVAYFKRQNYRIETKTAPSKRATKPASKDGDK